LGFSFAQRARRATTPPTEHHRLGAASVDASQLPVATIDLNQNAGSIFGGHVGLGKCRLPEVQMPFTRGD
jgi:hypothetical protein